MVIVNVRWPTGSAAGNMLSRASSSRRPARPGSRADGGPRGLLSFQQGWVDARNGSVVLRARLQPGHHAAQVGAHGLQLVLRVLLPHAQEVLAPFSFSSIQRSAKLPSWISVTRYCYVSDCV